MADSHWTITGQRGPRAEQASSGKPEIVRVWLLGGFRVSVGSRIVEENRWRLKKAAGLVKLLALAPNHRMHRGRIVDALWPELDREAAINNLRGALYAARRAFGSASTSPHLRLQNEELALCPEGHLRVDVEAFEEAADTAHRTHEPAAYRTAVELYSGELLPEDRYEAWVEDRREELRETYLALLLNLASLHEERGEYEPGIEALKQALAEEPLREEAHTRLMRLYALSGRRSQALRQYERLSEILSHDLDIEPGDDAVHLYREILSGRFPPVRRSPEDRPSDETPHARLHNLPITRGSFVGREHDVAETRRLLSMTGLLTLTGAGGSGKTRLALEVARELAPAYPDGAWLVELADLSEEELVPQEVAATLGVREQPGHPLTDTLVETLKTKKMLVVLDNCEHLVEVAARLADRLLDSCPGLRILATSREPLNIADEVTWRVPPLSVPGADLLPASGDLLHYGAVRLFVERARLKLPTFEVTPENARAVAEVCRKLDGIPLAIELATARITMLAVEQVAERLENSLELLSGGMRTAAQRHQTMRAMLAWSHELLDEHERELFGRLSVFAGGWDLEAAEAVGSGEGIEEDEILDLLSRLVDKSLAVAEAREEGALRYRFLQPVRQYAREKLEESGQMEQVLRRHAGYYLAFAEQAERELGAPDQALWLDRLETEHDNLRAALRWSLEGEEPGLGLGLAAALWLFWYTRGYLSEGREWLEKAAFAAGARALLLKAWTLCNAGHIAMRQGDLGAAKELVKEALNLFRETEDKEGIVSALTLLGMAAVLGQQDLETVPALYEEAASLRPQIEDQRAVAYFLLFSGIIAVGGGDWKQAEALHEESLEMFRELRDVPGTSTCLTNLGLISLARAEYPKAAARLRENLRVVPESDEASILHNFVGLACAASAQDQPARAARLWGTAEAIQETSDIQLTPITRSRIDHDEHLSTARSQLGEAAFAAAWAQGKAMTQEEAARFALGDAEPTLPTIPGQVYPTYAATRSDESLVRVKAKALNGAGYLAIFQGQYEAAKGLLEEALALFRELEDKEGIASSTTNLGLTKVLGQQELETVPTLLGEAMSLRSEIEDRHTVANMLIVSGLFAGILNDWERAEADHEEALRLFRELQDSLGMSMCATNLGLIALVRAHYDRATARLKENLRLSRGLDYKAGIHYSLFGLAGVAARQGRSTHAARLWGAAETLRETFGIGLTPLARRRLDYEGDVATVRSRLGNSVFAATWAEGKALTQEEAVRFALGDSESRPPGVLDRGRSSAVHGSDVELLRMRAEALGRAGYLATFQDDYETAKGLLEETLALFRELGDKEGIASSLTRLGLAAVAVQQDLETVPTLLEEASSLRPEIRDGHTLANMLVVSGLLAASRGDWERAVADHEEALQLFREVGDSQGESMCTNNLGWLALIGADYEKATALLKENVRMSRRLDHKASMHYSLIGLAGVAVRREQPARAARLWGAAETMRESFGIQFPSMGRRHLDYEGEVAAVRSQLGEAAFSAAWSEGKAMAQEEVVRFALGSAEPSPPETTPPARRPSRDLTRREEEVAALVARELSNRQIAEELSISERTIETHVRNALKKLGLKSRFQIAERWPDLD